MCECELVQLVFFFFAVTVVVHDLGGYFEKHFVVGGSCVFIFKQY